jgi:putative permease
MGRSLRLHPVSLIFTLLVMTTLFGIIGALLAVPVPTILKVCWEELYLKPRGINSEAIEERASDIIQRHPFRRRARAR